MSPSGLDPALVDRIARALDLRVFVEVVQRPLDRLQAIRAPFAESRSIPPGESPSQELVQANCLYLMPGVPEGEGPARLIDAIRRVGTLNRRSALVVEDVTGFLTGGALDGEPDLMDLLSALKQLSGDHRLLLTGPAVWYFPPLADAAVREHTGRRGIDWTDTGYRSDQLQEAESRAAAKDQVIAELSRELEAASRDRADKDEFINRLSGELPLMQTLIFVDAKLRRYLGAFLWPLRLVVRLVARTAGRLFAVRLNHDAQYPPRPLPDPGDYRPCPMPANPPVISIVTPSFNQGAFLKDTIDSVTGQAYPRLQYVVQDGGSKDDTVEVLGHASDRLTYWESRPDGGQANAVNLGMRRVTGDILAWLNSDDLLLPGSLAYVASYFGQHPEIDVVYGNRILIDSQGRDIGRWITRAELSRPCVLALTFRTSRP